MLDDSHVEFMCGVEYAAKRKGHFDCACSRQPEKYHTHIAKALAN